MPAKREPNPGIYDFAVIGSGFGGSVSAMRLAEKDYSVLVLERGKRFNAEDFPKTNWNLFKYLWMPALRCFGIQVLTFFKDMWVLSGSGVGGGSLVYAGTHLKPGRPFFESPDWVGLADWEAELAPHFETAERMLGVTENPKLWPADHVLQDIARDLGRERTFEPTPVAIFFGEPGEKVADPYFGGAGPDRAGCIHCGGCMVGCRYNAKNTLDKNYLYFAEKSGARVLPEANVTSIQPLYGAQADGARYEVVYERITDWFFKRKRVVRARNVVLSAGVFGTINLLLHCRDEIGTLPLISHRVGANVRSNSEALMGITAYDDEVDYSQGIAITSHFWVDEVTTVEPVRYSPGSSFMRTLVLPIVEMEGSAWRRLGQIISDGIRKPLNFLNVRVLPKWAEKNTVLLIMQSVENRMRLKRGRSIWTAFRRDLVSEKDFFEPIPAVIEIGKQVTKSFAKKVRGVSWSGINDVLLNTPATAHILGGCGIGRDPESGVVDANQRVFNYPGLYVADVSVIPANLGVNPALTITAMTERAMSLIPPANESEPAPPLEAPEGYHPLLEETGIVAGKRIFLSLLLFALSFLALRLLLRKR